MMAREALKRSRMANPLEGLKSPKWSETRMRARYGGMHHLLLISDTP